MTINLPDRSSLTAISRRVDKALPATARERIAPLFYAGALLAAGAILLKVKPRFAHVPQPAQFGDLPRRSRWRRAAHATRDSVSAFAPTNITDQIGRSLILGGAALIVTRLMDEAAGRDGQ